MAKGNGTTGIPIFNNLLSTEGKDETNSLELISNSNFSMYHKAAAVILNKF